MSLEDRYEAVLRANNLIGANLTNCKVVDDLKRTFNDATLSELSDASIDLDNLGLYDLDSDNYDSNAFSGNPYPAPKK